MKEREVRNGGIMNIYHWYDHEKSKQWGSFLEQSKAYCIASIVSWCESECESTIAPWISQIRFWEEGCYEENPLKKPFEFLFSQQRKTMRGESERERNIQKVRCLTLKTILWVFHCFSMINTFFIFVHF